MPEIFGKILVFKLFKSIHAESMRNFFRNIPILGLPLFAFSLRGEKREKKIVSHFEASPCFILLSAKFSKNGKPFLSLRLPLGGKLSVKRTDEGRN